MQIETIKKIKENYDRLERSLVEQLFLEFSHNPTMGSYREDIWCSLFRQIVPYKFAIEKAVFIIDSCGEISKEVDLAIFDEQYTPYIFNYGNVRFIPIEAVAVVIQCKSNSIDNGILGDWSNSITSLKTNTRSIARMYNGIVNSFLDAEDANNLKIGKVTQTATTPIKILCHLRNANGLTKPENNIFDIILCANYEDTNSPMLDIDFADEHAISEWYNKLNHADSNLHKYRKEYSNTDKLKSEYDAGNNNLLSFIFQLNQLLMLINNPMLFPHQAYAEMFRKV